MIAYTWSLDEETGEYRIFENGRLIATTYHIRRAREIVYKMGQHERADEVSQRLAKLRRNIEAALRDS